MTPQQAKSIILRMVANFPGLVNGEDDVPGAELVEWVSNEIFYLMPDAELSMRAEEGFGDEDETPF